MNKKTLKGLYKEHIGKVSDKWFFYLDKYDYLLDFYREKSITLLEIGIQNGGSLEIWSKYFVNASLLVGCDINPACSELTYTDKRIKVIIGDANDSLTQENILQKSKVFDIIIDDGSHMSGDIIRTFSLYFSQLAEGGIYVVEDLHCSYWEQYQGGLFSPESSMAFFKQLTDILNYEHWGIQKTRTSILDGFLKSYNISFSDDLLAQIHSVEFANSMCIIRKAAPEKNKLNYRFVAGSSESVFSSKNLHNVLYELPLGLYQENNPWTNTKALPQETSPELKRYIINLNQSLLQRNTQIDSLNKTISQRDFEINALYRSHSWRITKLLRIISGSINQLLQRAKKIASFQF